MLKVRIKATGQIIDMIAEPARALINRGMAEPVPSLSVKETASLSSLYERAAHFLQSRFYRIG